MTSTKARSQPGMVSGSTKMLLRSVRGIWMKKLAIETDVGVRRAKLSFVQTHDRPNKNTSRRQACERTSTSMPSRTRRRPNSKAYPGSYAPWWASPAARPTLDAVG